MESEPWARIGSHQHTLPDTFGPTKAKNPVEYGSMLKIDFTRGIPNTPPHYNGAPGQDYLIAPSPSWLPLAH